MARTLLETTMDWDVVSRQPTCWWLIFNGVDEVTRNEGEVLGAADVPSRYSRF
jgi:hypothetical protein